MYVCVCVCVACCARAARVGFRVCWGCGGCCWCCRPKTRGTMNFDESCCSWLLLIGNERRAEPGGQFCAVYVCPWSRRAFLLFYGVSTRASWRANIRPTRVRVSSCLNECVRASQCEKVLVCAHELFLTERR